MATLKSIHHINFIVADLDASVRAYQDLLGLGPFDYEELPQRGVSTARTRIGEVWVVLVSPQSENSAAGRYLKVHGEGFFLLSFGVDNLDRAMAELAGRGAVATNDQPRTGLLGWRVADLKTDGRLGARFHLTQAD